MADGFAVSVIGAGTMGAGLAVQFAHQGMDVTLIDHRESNLSEARSRIRDAVTFLRAESLTDCTLDEVLDRIECTLDQDAGVANAALVLETVSEDLDLKRRLFQSVGEVAPSDAILASNTSGLRLTEIADGVPEYSSRIVGCHWWNPPYLMPLVEIVPTPATDPTTVADLEEMVEAVDRTPLLVEQDIPGFIWNRIQFAVLRECMYLAEEGVASIEDIDTAVREGYALRTAAVGPFETVDISGLGLFQTIADELYPELSTTESPSDLFDEYLAADRRGIETGAGFHEYSEAPESVVKRRDKRIAHLRRAQQERH